MHTPTIHVESVHTQQLPIILEPANADTLAELWPLDDSVSRFLPTDDRPYFATADDLLARVGFRGEAWNVSTVLEENTPRLVGMIGLALTDLHYPIVSTLILDREYHGRGIGTLAKIGIGAYAAQQELPYVQARTLAANIAGRRSLVKSGFVQLPDSEPQREIPYGDGTEKSPKTNWIMIPHLNGYTSKKQAVAQRHFARVQAAHNVRFA